MPATPKRRPKRIPIGTRSKLKAPDNTGFVRRFVNDDPGRIQMFLDAGYRIVSDGSKASDEDLGEGGVLGSATGKHVGGGKMAYLMEIPKEFYTEDQIKKQTDIETKEKSLLRDQQGKDITENDSIYGEGVSIKSNRPKVQID